MKQKRNRISTQIPTHQLAKLAQLQAEVAHLSQLSKEASLNHLRKKKDFVTMMNKVAKNNGMETVNVRNRLVRFRSKSYKETDAQTVLTWIEGVTR